MRNNVMMNGEWHERRSLEAEAARLWNEIQGIQMMLSMGITDRVKDIDKLGKRILEITGRGVAKRLAKNKRFRKWRRDFETDKALDRLSN